MLLRDVPLQEINNNLNNKKVNNRHFYKIYSEYLRRILNKEKKFKFLKKVKNTKQQTFTIYYYSEYL